LSDFEQWWSVYPRKRDKRAAQKAYTSAKRQASTAELMAGVQRDAECWKRYRYEIGFIPYPATWLNAGAWLGDPPEPRANGTPSKLAGKLDLLSGSVQRSQAIEVHHGHG
jgi:hypothetical protein